VKVEDVTTDHVVTMTRKALIGEVRQRTEHRPINGLLVMDEEGQSVAVVTQGDDFRASLQDEAELLADESVVLVPDRLREHIPEAPGRPVSTIESRRIGSVAPDWQAALAGGMGLDHRITELPALDGGTLVSVLTPHIACQAERRTS